MARFNHHEHEIITPRGCFVRGCQQTSLHNRQLLYLAQPPSDYDLRWGVKIQCATKSVERDVVFAKDSRRLAGEDAGNLYSAPVKSRTRTARAAYFASHGCVFALVDVRGRSDSGGSLSHSQMNHATGTTWLNGSRSNHSVTAKWPCGAVHMRLRSMGNGEGISASSGDNRACCRRASRPGLSIL